MDNEQEKAIAEIEALGGRVEFDEKRSGKPGIQVDFSFLPVTDAGLEQLKGLRQLQWLDLEAHQGDEWQPGMPQRFDATAKARPL